MQKISQKNCQEEVLPDLPISWLIKLPARPTPCLRHCVWYIARNASHFTAKRASSAFVTIERSSTKNRRPRADRPLRCLRTDRLRVKLKDLRGRVPVGRFFLFIFVGSCIVRTFCICRSPHGLLSCLSFSACVNGRDVRELDDLSVVLLLVYRKPSS